MKRPANIDGSEQDAACGEGIYKTGLSLVESCVSDPQGFGFGAVSSSGGDGLNAVRGKIAGNVGIDKSTRAQIMENKVGVEDINSPVGAVISGEKQGEAAICGDGQTGVNRADAGTISLEGGGADAVLADGVDSDGVRRTIPGDNGAVER